MSIKKCQKTQDCRKAGRSPRQAHPASRSSNLGADTTTRIKLGFESFRSAVVRLRGVVVRLRDSVIQNSPLSPPREGGEHDIYASTHQHIPPSFAHTGWNGTSQPVIMTSYSSFLCELQRDALMSVVDDLERLRQLRESGAMSEEEFAQAKARLLSGSGPNPETERETRVWATLLHLSVFIGYPAPIVGFIAPILIWQLKKDALPQIDAHGRVVVNWIITHLIYWVICAILWLVLIGIPMSAVLALLSIIFPIVGAIKAHEGKVWRYPLSINFF